MPDCHYFRIEEVGEFVVILVLILPPWFFELQQDFSHWVHSAINLFLWTNLQPAAIFRS
jgi:hypothetical protein